MKSLRKVAIAVSLASVLTILGCTKSDDQSGEQAPADAGLTRFELAKNNAGLDFVHQMVTCGKYEIAEITGSGLAVFDADGDDDLDVLCLDSGETGKGARNRLYLRGPDGLYAETSGGPGFEQVAFSLGVAVGDVDNDGDLDLFIANLGPDVLLLNDGKAGFTALDPAFSGIGDPGYSTSAAFIDYDLDGLLDLYVCRYVVPELGRTCPGVDSRQDYCHPAAYRPTTDRLYHNLGGGRFQDVSHAMGIEAASSYGLGVAVIDIDDDGDLDLYVANDSRPNFLWVNQGGHGFRDEALQYGLAVNGQGMPEASMGIAIGDVDGNGMIDIFVTHLRAESNTLYLREKFGFTDGTSRAKLSLPSMAFTGFGTVLFDFDNDLDLDLAVANGSVGRHDQPPPGARPGSRWEFYVEPNQLYENTGGTYEEAPQKGGAFCSAVDLSRALLAADLDQDGDLDLLTGNTGGPLQLALNKGGAGNYIKFRVIDPALQRDALGALVTIRVGDRRLQRRVAFDCSYLSANAEAVHFGLGAADKVDEVEVIWPGGAKQSFGSLPGNRSHVLKRVQ